MDVAVILKPWYKKWWGITSLVVGGAIIFMLTVFGYITLSYLRQIKQGDLITLEGSGGRFSAAAGPVSQNGVLSAAERKDLEQGDFLVFGQADAPITVVEFIDFKCPNCKLAVPIVAQVLQKYPGKVRFVFRNFPVESLHPGATQLAEVGQCAKAQNLFWPVYDFFFASQDTFFTSSWGEAEINELVKNTRLDKNKLNACLSTPATAVAINRDYADGLRFGVRGTPTFFINGERVEGVIPFELWDRFLSSK